MRTLLAAFALLLVLATPALADGPGSARPVWSRSATPRSPARPAAGPATRTSPPRGRRARLAPLLRHADRRGDPRLSPLASRRRSTSAAASTASTSPARARDRRRHRVGGRTSSPAIDFYTDSAGRQGQALTLQDFATTHNVRVVVVLIGANNYGFADDRRSAASPTG